MTATQVEAVRVGMMALACDAIELARLREFAHAAFLVRGALTLSTPPTPAAVHAAALRATWQELEPLLVAMAEEREP